jgi:hypothetical protein
MVAAAKAMCDKDPILSLATLDEAKVTLFLIAHFVIFKMLIFLCYLLYFIP